MYVYVYVFTDRHMPSENLQTSPLCVYQSASGSEGCHHVTLREIMIDVIITYVVHATIYVSVVSYVKYRLLGTDLRT